MRGAAGASAAAANALNGCDVAIVQHEYGIFGGRDGADVLTVVRALRVPVIVVLHTVLEVPSHHQRAILEELVSASSVVVTMTRTAHDRLVALYAVDAAKVRVIPHGAADTRAEQSRRPASTRRRAGMRSTALAAPWSSPGDSWAKARESSGRSRHWRSWGTSNIVRGTRSSVRHTPACWKASARPIGTVSWSR